MQSPTQRPLTITVGERIMREFTLVDCETGLIYGPYQSCAMARADAEAKAIAAWEIFTDDDKLLDWEGAPIRLPDQTHL
jgi:hypothetical protein